MKRLAIVIMSGLALGACSSAEDRSRKALEANLPIKDELELNEVSSYPGDVICGSFSATTSYLDGRRERAPFILRNDELNTSPISRDWRIYCQEDPAAALLQETGIGPFADHAEALLKIARDFRILETALEEYYSDIYEFPTTEEGLGALEKAPEGIRRRKAYREGGYLDDMPVDPWGRPYGYEHVRWAGSRGQFSFYSLGQAGMPGGEGADADVSYDDLPYLEHVATALELR